MCGIRISRNDEVMKAMCTNLINRVLMVSTLCFLSFAGCKDMGTYKIQDTWRVELCKSNYGSHDPWLLLRFGIAATNQSAVAKMIRLISEGGPECEGCFCGPETYQVFESNGVPVMVVSAEMNGRVVVECPKVVRNSLGYFVFDNDEQQERKPFKSEEYYKLCHTLFMNGIEADTSTVVGFSSRGDVWSVSRGLEKSMRKVGGR